ncbi:MAG: nucleoside kinase [Bacteroidaceae bacterium]|nr:nucleoside kinase [Bacteroidaceae bacterium]
MGALTPDVIANFKQNKLSDVVNSIVGDLELNKTFVDRLLTYSLTVGEVNELIDSKMVRQAVSVLEKLKEVSISSIAEDIAAGGASSKNKEGKGVIPKIVLIAGPSSSGKTTFCKKMVYALEQQGLDPRMLSLDDYYQSYEKTPLDENGEYDFESLYALDLELLQDHLQRLINGEAVVLPKYEFSGAERQWQDEPMQLGKDSILLIEGIHGLNPELTGNLDPSLLYRIYISGSSLKTNKDGRYFMSTDNRLIRRMVRDSKYRNTNAQTTIDRWPSVRRGESRWIVPYQKFADANINTSFPYELGILRHDAIPLLKAVGKDEPAYFEARRLLHLLDEIHPLSVDVLPKYSILREFVGGSGYEY